MTRRAIHIISGIVLLGAAVLKLHGWLFGVSQIPLPPYVIMIGWQLEVLLGVWLLAGLRLRLATLLTSFFFAALAIVNIWLIRSGASGCGCLGVVNATPWLMLVVDLLIACTLGWAFFGETQSTKPTTIARREFLFPTISMLVFVSLVGIWFLAQSVPGVASVVNSDLVVIDAVHVGDVQSREPLQITISVQNVSNEPLMLLGAKSWCRLKFGLDFPISIPPGDSVNVPASFWAPGNEGKFQNRFALYTDASTSLSKTGLISGRVVSKGEGALIP